MNHPIEVVESSGSQIAVGSPCMQLLPIASATSAICRKKKPFNRCALQGGRGTTKSSTWGENPQLGGKILNLGGKSSTWGENPQLGGEILNLGGKSSTWGENPQLGGL